MVAGVAFSRCCPLSSANCMPNTEWAPPNAALKVRGSAFYMQTNANANAIVSKNLVRRDDKGIVVCCW